MSQVRVPKATVAKVIVPNSMAVANDDTGASAITEALDVPILSFTDSFCNEGCGGIFWSVW